MKRTKELINKKELLNILKSDQNIRVSPKVIKAIKKKIRKEVELLSKRLNEEAKTSGRKTIIEEDLNLVLKNKEEYPEI